MKRFFVPGVFFFLLFLASCKEDEKDDCSEDVTSKFPGTWNITETCGSQDYNYPLTISAGTSSDLIFKNIGQGGANAEIKVDVCGSNFTIPAQTVQGTAFSGDGSINAGNQITFSWEGNKGNCSATGIKDDCIDYATLKFPGIWNITETCGSQNFNYELTVTIGTESDLLFQNIGQGGSNATVKVDVYKCDFTIPSQTVQSIGFSGDGTINSVVNQITFSWTGHKGNCSATGIKQ